jgi:hypothetical protein
METNKKQLSKEQKRANIEKYNKIYTTTAKVVGSVIAVGGVSGLLGWKQAAAKGIDPDFKETDIKPEDIHHSSVVTNSSEMSFDDATKWARNHGGPNSYFEYNGVPFPSLYKDEIPDPTKGLAAKEVPTQQAIVDANEHTKAILNDVKYIAQDNIKNGRVSKDVSVIDDSSEPYIVQVPYSDNLDEQLETEKARNVFGKDVIMAFEQSDGSIQNKDAYTKEELEEIKSDPELSAKYEERRSEYGIDESLEPFQFVDNDNTILDLIPPIEDFHNPLSKQYSEITYTDKYGNEGTILNCYDAEMGTITQFKKVGESFEKISSIEIDDDGNSSVLPLDNNEIIEIVSNPDIDWEWVEPIDENTISKIEVNNTITPKPNDEEGPSEPDSNTNDTYDYIEDVDVAELSEAEIKEINQSIEEDEEEEEEINKPKIPEDEEGEEEYDE